ncbi:hypothetical protein HOLleu_10808 [Holothuria leucospilota]|uniref:Uncharacterized protein n=1 Tax=Holothuria leucospilota TaxID=206669 RepID=A0A9Q1CET2_HOLLE|nr:hypothetical protein HOLleu_10808 [Holothuria leucospilota]
MPMDTGELLGVYCLRFKLGLTRTVVNKKSGAEYINIRENASRTTMVPAPGWRRQLLKFSGVGLLRNIDWGIAGCLCKDRKRLGKAEASATEAAKKKWQAYRQQKIAEEEANVRAEGVKYEAGAL